MNRLISSSLALLLAASLWGCGSDSSNVASLPSSLSGFDAADVYNGFVLGRVKLPRTLAAGKVDITTMDGQVLYQVDAGPDGFFYYRGYFPPDCRLRAKRGNDVYELEHHGVWKGGTLYINAGTTIAAAYHRAHPGLTPEQVEAKFRSAFKLPADMPLSWISVVRHPNFSDEIFFNEVQRAGLASHLDFLVRRMDLQVQPLFAEADAEVVKSLMGFTYDTFVSPAVGTAYGDAVANMGFNFTTAGALNNIENSLQAVSDQVSALSDQVADVIKDQAFAALKSDLETLSDNALQISNAMGNITLAVQARQSSTQPYQTPSNYTLDETVGQVNSLNLSNLTDPIAANITSFSTQGLYGQLVRAQMQKISQTDTSANGYPWRSNQLTTQQFEVMGNYATALGQSAYLEAEYANLQGQALATALNTARQNMDKRAYQVQLASQLVPDLFPGDEVLFDPQHQEMWFSANLNWFTPEDAGDFIANLEVANYKDWGFPTSSMMDHLIKSRVLPATGITTNSDGTWADAPSATWKNAFNTIGLDMSTYAQDRGGNKGTSEGCWYNTSSFTTGTSGLIVQFYDWNGNGKNPSVQRTGSNPAANTLAVRRYGQPGGPETNAVAVTPPPFNYSPHSGDSAQSTNGHSAALTQYYVSPFQLPIPSGWSMDFSTQDTLGKAYVFACNFITGAADSSNTETRFGTASFDISNRVAWSVDRPDLCRVSNYLTSNSSQVHGGGYVTWFPPLDGSQITATVTLKSELHCLFSDFTPRTITETRAITPQEGYRPYLDSVYAVPQNKIYDLSQQPATIRMTALAVYKDGRVFDISTDSNTVWTLTDSNTGAVINSSSTGGFKVLQGQAANDLYLTTGLPGNDVTFTVTYSSKWAGADPNATPVPTKTFSGKLQVVKGPPTITSITPSFGSSQGGNVVRINGSGFTEGSIAYFGNTPATSTFFVTSNQLTVTVPPGAVGAVAVKVITSTSQTQNSANYNYTN